jgi:drug/metabolite transporter (DMT)-like permease
MGVNKMSKNKAILALLLLSFVKSIGYSLNDFALKYIGVLQLQTIHFFVTALLMWIFFFKHVKQANSDVIKRGVLLGVIFFLGITFQTMGLETTTVSKNSFLTVLEVVFIAIISDIFFKQKNSKDFIVGIVIMFIGFFLLLFKIDFLNLSSSLLHLQNEANFVIGDFYTIICAFIFAIHIILAGRFVKKDDPLALVTIQMSVCAILNLGVSLVQRDSVFNLANHLNSVYLGLITAVILGIVGLYTFASQMHLQRFVSAATTAIILSTESLFATIIAIISGLEKLNIGMFLGGILITIGIIITQVGETPEKPLK